MEESIPPTLPQIISILNRVGISITIKHANKVLKDRKMDEVKRKWAGKLSIVAKPGHSQASVLIPASSSSSTVQNKADQVEPGWASRTHKTAQRYSPDVHAFLRSELMKGVTSWMKETPDDVSRRMKALFSRDHWLTQQQIMSHFSRLSARQKCGRLPDLEDENVENCQ